MREYVMEEEPTTIDWDGTKESLKINEAKLEEMFKIDLECIEYNYPYCNDK